MATTELIPAKNGRREIKFKKGGLHQSLGVPLGVKIPPSKMPATLNGDYGMKAKKETNSFVVGGRHYILFEWNTASLINNVIGN